MTKAKRNATSSFWGLSALRPGARIFDAKQVLGVWRITRHLLSGQQSHMRELLELGLCVLRPSTVSYAISR